MWSKGPRCGVDNCPSRFWRSIGGNQVCQYGHVREGIEIGQDEDDFVHGRRIKRPKQDFVEKQKETNYVFGKDAESIMAKSTQKVLKLQLKFMTNHHIKHKDYAGAVKSIWLGFLKGTKLGGSTGKLSIGPSQNVSILYLACVMCGIPLYLVDFWRLVYRYELPYFDAYDRLFGNEENALPPNIVDRVRPRHLPGYEKLYNNARAIATYLEQHENFKFPEVMPGPLIFKVVQDLLLPPQIHTTVVRLLSIVKARFDLGANKTGVKVQSPENMIVCMTAVAVKLCYGLDNLERSAPQGTAAADAFDWEVWQEYVTKLWLLDDEFTYADERSVIYWDQDKTNRYLTWFQKYVQSDTFMRKPSVVENRMLNMFPVQDIPKQQALGTKDYEEIVPELLASLHETSQSTVNKGHPPPGSNYPQYNNVGQPDWSLPDLMHTLFQVCSRFLNVSHEQFRSMMYRLEGYLRVAHRDIYLVMERDDTTVWTPPNRLSREQLDLRKSTQRARDRASRSISASPSIPPFSSQSSPEVDSLGDQSRRT
ncbi:RNA polymerase I-specific transcription initiation factor rrn7 [Wickerhamiella sorbophila]|uniref:RNA polymerase I-specific transcription initiation factor rrn7 n=1 Tax=Wickerhamiella sorbophila TaxID=45607 RepID=A0A2T0FH19_9ASCO|nr:RNA polymerase I-specific transcription initiation factor rrn7 [Wickerhamiella sorbophila]PRT54303.1 RNA polymerase I-specific transcription initiation factor rrn7 [Wickerhamiella sorbophila]